MELSGVLLECFVVLLVELSVEGVTRESGPSNAATRGSKRITL